MYKYRETEVPQGVEKIMDLRGSLSGTTQDQVYADITHEIRRGVLRR